MDLQKVDHRNHTFSNIEENGAHYSLNSIDYDEEFLALAVNDPVFSIVCDLSLDRVVRRGHQLEASIEAMRTEYPKEVEALLTQYHQVTVKIEMDKLTAVMNSTSDKYKRLNNYYNHRRHSLMSILEEEIDRLKNQKAYRYSNSIKRTINENEPKAKTTPTKLLTEDVTNLDKDVNWRALKIMQEWYITNEEHPYPSDKDLRDISKKGKISEADINTWFQFERIRRAGISP